MYLTTWRRLPLGTEEEKSIKKIGQKEWREGKKEKRRRWKGTPAKTEKKGRVAARCRG